MGTPFLGEIRTFGFTFNPRGWAFCNGQTLALAQNQALFALLGTTYGGNGQTTFALPNLQGQVALHFGQSPGGSSYQQGQVGGSETVTLTTSQMPQHSHAMTTFDTKASLKEPATGSYLGRGTDGSTVGSSPQIYVPTGTNTNPVTLNPTTIGTTGGSTAHPNMQPFLVLNLCIALQGIFPSRN